MLLLTPESSTTTLAPVPTPPAEELATLRLENATLRAENAALQARVRELEAEVRRLRQGRTENAPIEATIVPTIVPLAPGQLPEPADATL